MRTQTQNLNYFGRVDLRTKTQNQSYFGRVAQRSKDFTFCLWDRGKPFSYTVVRNGLSVSCSGEYTMFLAPEELTREQDARNTVTQTPHGAWTDSFGAGLVKWSLRGSTGWRARTANNGVTAPIDGREDGYTAFHVFSELINVYLNENQARAIEAFKSGRILRPLLVLVFHDHADDEWWSIEPDGLPTKRRSTNRPLLYDYEFRFTGTRDLTQRIGPLPDAIGQALRGSDTRDQKTADALIAAIPATNSAIDEYENAAKQNPVDAALIDGWMTQTLDRLISGSPDGWSPAEVSRTMGAAGLPSSAFDIPVKSLSDVETPSFLTRCQQVMAQAKEFGTAVEAWRKQTTAWIAAPIKMATECMSGVRDVMNAIAFASNAVLLTTQVRNALRRLRTELRNLWCAGQSLLSFPYNFVQGLKATAQDLLNLFKLSGCATTFPYVPNLTWQGPQMTIPSPTQ